MNRHDLRQQKEKQYEIWVFSRINDKKAMCHLYGGQRCIPSNDHSCQSCYHKYVAV